jgi:transcription initiation factor IIE alpha subunit
LYWSVDNFYSRRQWVREEDLAKDLNLHTKQLRRSLQLFEDENIITRDHRREVAIQFRLFITLLVFCELHLAYQN